MLADNGAASTVATEPAALQQFLRGVCKRAMVLAHAQCGDSERALQAVQGSLFEFRALAASQSMASWPQQFWQLLLAQPGLRTYRVVADADGRDRLACLSGGPRAALLLRLVAGLDGAQAAAVLRVSPQSFRVALLRALHTLHADGMDDGALQLLRERLQQRVRSAVDPLLPTPVSATRAIEANIKPATSAVADRLASSHQIAATRTPRVLAGSRALAIDATPRRTLRRLLVAALGVLVLVFVATFFWPRALLTDKVSVNQLPEQPVAVRLDAVSAALANPDFDLLNDPAGEHDARELALLSWFDAAPATNPASDPSSALPESATPESSTPDPEEQQNGGSPHAP